VTVMPTAAIETGFVIGAHPLGLGQDMVVDHEMLIIMTKE
jgi:hypothetical protein